MLQTVVPEQHAVASRWHGLSRRTRWILGILVLLVLALAAWHFISAWLAGRHKKAPPAPPVKVASVQRKTVNVYAQTIGQVVSVTTVNVTAQVTGKLLKAFFIEGQIVRKGDPLFQIDPAPFQAQLEQATAQLARDQAQLVSLANDEHRYTTLYAQNAASQQQRDQAVAAAKGQVALVQSDQAAVDIARQNLGYTLIRSPVDGKTGAIQIQPGNLITANATSPLVIVTQVQPIMVSFALPQDQLSQIQAQLTAGTLAVVIPMGGGVTEKANADFVSNIVNASTGTIEVRATFPNTDGKLVPGQSVHLSAAIQQLPNTLVVPRDAVNVGPDASFVLAVGKDGKAYQKTVTVLNDDGIQDAITSDSIKPNDKVITDGQLRVVAGQPVHVTGGKVPSSGSAPQ